MADRASLRDVAQAAGVAPSTVSLALRGDVRVAAGTRSRIAEAARRLGYRPRPELAALAAKRFVRSTQRKHPILCVLAPRLQGWLRDQFPIIADVAGQHGYDAIVLHYEAGESADAVRARIQATGCLGLAVCHHPGDGPGIYDGWHPFPIICLGLNQPRMPCHAVHGDPFASCLQVWQEVIRRGWRRIGLCLLVHEPMVQDDYERLAASSLAQQQWLTPAERLPIFRYRTLREHDPALRSWVEGCRPEALIGFNAWAPSILERDGYPLPHAGLVIHPSARGRDGRRPSGLLNPGAEVLARGTEHLIAAIRFSQVATPRNRQSIRIQSLWQEGDTLPFRR